MSALRFTAVFSASFAILYVVAMEMNIAIFTYHPRLMVFGLGTEAPRSGPAIYWFGWMATAALGGLALGVLAGVLPARDGRLWYAIGWFLPLGAMLAALYFMIPFFTK